MEFEMYWVNVCRNEPYVESLWYDFTDFDEAVDYCRKIANLNGVECVELWLDDKILVNRWVYYAV